MPRPMVVRFGALGDMVLMTVPIRILNERFGEPVDVLGSGAWTRPLLEGQRGVGDIFVMGSRHRPYVLAPDQWRLVEALARRTPAPTWLFDPSNDTVRALFKRAGWRDEFLISLQELPDIADEHFCDRWSRFAQLRGSLGIHPVFVQSGMAAVPRLEISQASRCESESWLNARGLSRRNLILIQPGNKRTMRRGTAGRASNTKYWPEERWAAVLRGLRGMHPEHALILTGIATEARLNDHILSLAGVDDAHNLAREMTISRLMALARRAFGMLSVDTGPAHVAAALSTPVLTLFDSPSKSAMYTPRGPRPGCLHALISSDARPSLCSITPQQVLAAWENLLDSISASQVMQTCS